MVIFLNIRCEQLTIHILRQGFVIFILPYHGLYMDYIVILVSCPRIVTVSIYHMDKCCLSDSIQTHRLVECK
jgi:hypothetical protein